MDNLTTLLKASIIMERAKSRKQPLLTMNPTAEQVIESLQAWNNNQATIKKSLIIDLQNWIYLTK